MKDWQKKQVVSNLTQSIKSLDDIIEKLENVVTKDIVLSLVSVRDEYIDFISVFNDGSWTQKQ